MLLTSYLTVLRRRWLTVVLAVVVGLAASALITMALPTTYTATTRLFFGVQSGESATDLSQGSTFAEKQMTSYAQVAVSPLVLNPVIKELRLSMSPEELGRAVTASVPTDTVILEIAVTDSDPEQAARISNAIGSELADVAAGLSPPRPDGSESVKATTLAPAAVPADPSSPDVVRNLALGALLGLLVGITAALLRDAMDTKLRDTDDVQAVSSLPLLGTVPFDPEAPEHRLIIGSGEAGGRAEAIRRLRTNLQFVGDGGHPDLLVVTSSLPGEGKTTTAINLAAALADSGMRVLLIDSDLRRPTVAEYLGMEGRAGLTSILIGRAELEHVTQQVGERSLWVLASGPIPPNPSEILGSTAMRDLVAAARKQYDIVLLDSPPLLPVTDAAVLSRLAAGTVVVVGANSTHRPQLQAALQALAGVDAHVLGLIVNKLARRESARYGYGYGYGASGDHAGGEQVSFRPEHPQSQTSVNGKDRTGDLTTAGWPPNNGHLGSR